MAAWLGSRERFMVVRKDAPTNPLKDSVIQVLDGASLRPTPGSYYARTIADSSVVELDMHADGSGAWVLDREETRDLKMYAAGLLKGVPWVLEVLE